MKINENHQIWYEKYRPQVVEDLILPAHYTKVFKGWISNPTHILLCSITPGTGKTSTMNALIRESGMESLFINASLDTGIDVLRGKIMQFASTESLNGLKKVVVLDECDNFNANSAQPALRGLIEEFSINCVFILTCNYLSNIIEPIRNRFEIYDFDKIIQDNKKEIIPLIFNRLKFILENEKIQFQNSDIIDTIKACYPSFREMIGTLSKCSKTGTLLLQVSKDSDFSTLVEFIVKKDYENIIKSCYQMSNPEGFYSWLFNDIKRLKSKPQVLLTIAKYQYQNAFARDKNLNLAACCAELMNLI